MEPEILLRERAQVRRVFTRTANKTTHTEVDFDYLAEKAEMLAKLDRDIHDAMLSSENYDEAKFTTEYDECEAYQTRWRMLKKEISKPEDRRDFSYSYNKKLPKIELRQFDDNPKTWLSFWTQFKKIHEDKTMDEEDKFYYLIQAMAEGSNSKTIATSYPVTKENYYKVLETLKARYAKDEVLIEIYVRELLKLVMTKSNFALEVLYDKIIVNLQVLESLGITKDKYQCILLPLIESALPDATLNLWSKVKLTSESKLSQLLVFLNTEVESEARCKLARGTFTENAGCDAVPTAACLVSTKQKPDKKGNQKEYLLGKTIDSNYDRPEREQPGIPTVARRVVRSSMLAAGGDAQMDLVRKMREDPLLLVKERERAARAALLNNPLQRGKLTELLRKEQEQRKEKKSKNSKKNDLDDKLAEKLNALGGKRGIDLAALLASSESSSESSSTDEKSKKKKKKKKSQNQRRRVKRNKR